MSKDGWVEREMASSHGMWLVACQFCGQGSLVWRGRERGYRCTVCDQTNEVRPIGMVNCPKCKKENAVYERLNRRLIVCWNCGERVVVPEELL